MLLDAFDPVSPSRVFAFRGESQALGVIVDGVGSWGSGREAADRTREDLARRWQNSRSWSVESLAQDISSVASATPNELRDPEFGWSFSVTCLLTTDGLFKCVAAGFYRVDVCAPSGMTTVFRPEMLFDQLLANGTLSRQTAEAFPRRNVCLGPFVGDRNEIVLTRARHVLAPDEVAVVTHAARYDLAALRLPRSAEALAAMAQPDAYPSPVMIARPQQTT